MNRRRAEHASVPQKGSHPFKEAQRCRQSILTVAFSTRVNLCARRISDRDRQTHMNRLVPHPRRPSVSNNRSHSVIFATVLINRLSIQEFTKLRLPNQQESLRCHRENVKSMKLFRQITSHHSFVSSFPLIHNSFAPFASLESRVVSHPHT